MIASTIRSALRVRFPMQRLSSVAVRPNPAISKLTISQLRNHSAMVEKHDEHKEETFEEFTARYV